MTAVIEPRARTGYWEAVAGGDGDSAEAVAVSALEAGVPVSQVLEELVVAVQMEVGRLWATNEWSVAREHAATAVGERVVGRIAAELPKPSGRVVLVACVEREWHALPALVVATSLLACGVNTTYLGASTTRGRLAERILVDDPSAVLLSASLTSSLPRVRRHIEVVREARTPVVVGGLAFRDAEARAERLGATAYAASPDSAARVIPTLPDAVEAAPPLTHRGAREAADILAEADDVCRDVLASTDRRLGLTGGGEDATSPDDWRVVLATFVPHVVDSLAGALLTQDPTVMWQTRTWLDDVITRRGGDPRAGEAVFAATADRLSGLPEARALLRR